MQRVVPQAGEHGEAVVGREPEGRALPGEEVGERPMAAEDRLGSAGRAGGEAEDGDVVRTDGRRRERGNSIALRNPRQVEARAAGGGEPGVDSGGELAGRLQADERLGLGETQHLDQAGGRIGRVEHGEGGAAAQRPEHRGGERRAAVRPDRHPVSLLHSEAGEPDGEAGARTVEVAVGPRPLAVGDRRPLRGRRGARREQLVDGAVPGRIER